MVNFSTVISRHYFDKERDFQSLSGSHCLVLQKENISSRLSSFFLHTFIYLSHYSDYEITFYFITGAGVLCSRRVANISRSQLVL